MVGIDRPKKYARIKCFSSGCCLGFYALLIQKYGAVRRRSSAAGSWEKKGKRQNKEERNISVIKMAMQTP